MSKDNNNMTLEQKIVYHLAKNGFITNVAAVTKALREFLYAEKIIALEGEPGIKDDVKAAIAKGEIDIEGIEGDCSHEALSNEEIQEVFDNDKNK